MNLTGAHPTLLLGKTTNGGWRAEREIEKLSHTKIRFFKLTNSVGMMLLDGLETVDNLF